MNHEVGAQDAQDALVAMVVKDRDAVADVLDRIFQRGPIAVHGSLCGWAHIAATVMAEQLPPGSDEEWWIEVEDVETGKAIGLDDTDLTREQRDAVRIVTLWGNKDQDTIVAIIKAYLREPTPGPLVELMIAVLEMAAVAARYTIDNQERARREGK